jgi:TfoX/Sxy family transcriptional regulator of competence genes
MKLYSEEKMKAIREDFEEEFLQHPNVATKKMFGCPSYTANDKLFAFFVTEGIVLTKLLDSELAEALSVPGAQHFEHNQRLVKKWVRVPIKGQAALESVMQLIIKSYENALKAES